MQNGLDERYNDFIVGSLVMDTIDRLLPDLWSLNACIDEDSDTQERAALRTNVAMIYFVFRCCCKTRSRDFFFEAEPPGRPVT